MRSILFAALALAMVHYYDPCGAESRSMKIGLKVGEKGLEDYARTEKVSILPKRLSTEDAPSGRDPSVGDIAYYAPWGNLAIFYKDFGYSSGLTILGKIESGIEAFNVPGSLKVTIELIQ